MAIRTIALSALALTGLAACTTYTEPPRPAPVATVPAPVVTAPPAAAGASTAPASPVALAKLEPGTYQPGYGILESIGLVTLPPSTASGGATGAAATGAPAPGPYRLTVRMEDGTIQTLIQDTRALLVGDRLQVTEDGRLIRP